MILLGYHSTKGYMRLDPKSNQIIISRDVVIDEAKEWDWSEKEKGTTNMLFDLNNPEVSEPATTTITEARRSQRERELPQRLQDFEMVIDSTVDSKGYLIHFALFAEAEPVDFDEAMQDVKWIQAMGEELKAIEKNRT